MVLSILFYWSGTPVCSQLVFCRHLCVWRCIPDVSMERDVLHIHLLLHHLVLYLVLLGHWVSCQFVFLLGDASPRTLHFPVSMWISCSLSLLHGWQSTSSLCFSPVLVSCFPDLSSIFLLIDSLPHPVGVLTIIINTVLETKQHDRWYGWPTKCHFPFPYFLPGSSIEAGKWKTHFSKHWEARSEGMTQFWATKSKSVL